MLDVCIEVERVTLLGGIVDTDHLGATADSYQPIDIYIWSGVHQLFVQRIVQCDREHGALAVLFFEAVDDVQIVVDSDGPEAAAVESVEGAQRLPGTRALLPIRVADDTGLIAITLVHPDAHDAHTAVSIAQVSKGIWIG